MLQSLHIENVAVIERADITFGSGLTVLTGETGAGKSIVIDAINAVLGERITRDVVRHGADRADISAVFTDVAPAVETALQEQGYALEEDGTLLVQRALTADGRGSCRINGRPATVSVLRGIGRMLVNIHGQHENQVLLQPESHVEYLDRLGGLQAIRAAYEQPYHTYCRIRRAIRAAQMDADEREFRTTRLREQIEAIDAAALKPGEEEKLLARRETVRHAEKLAQHLQTACTALDGDGEELAGAVEHMAAATAALQAAGAVSPELAELAGRMQSTLYDLQACAEEVREAGDGLSFDAGEQAALEDRLALIQRLTRQYGGDETAVLQKREAMAAELAAIENTDAHLAELEKQSDAARAETIAAAERLTAARREAARRFEEDVCQQLTFLDMPHVRLQVSMEPTPLTVIGGDKVEFLISSNPGEPPKSIARTASGGELSRIMLALKRVLAEVDEIGTLVFDEVDSGISGRAATKVGILLRQTAVRRQVLCVTHLAQIAAAGHAHLLVSKSVADGRTYTCVQPLQEEQRVAELARIIGGEATETARSAAREMRTRAESGA